LQHPLISVLIASSKHKQWLFEVSAQFNCGSVNGP